MKILAIVGCDFLENRKRRKSKVSLAIYVSQGLVSTLVVPQPSTTMDIRLIFLN